MRCFIYLARYKIATHIFKEASGSSAVNGMRAKPSQKTGDEKTMRSWPAMTAPTGISGQKLLKPVEKSH
jgi:hypothetical protein